MIEAEIDDLASRVAGMTAEEAEAFDRSVIALRAERARAEEERIAGLRAQTDEEVVFKVLALADDYRVANAMTDQALALLRDAGFVRHVTLEAAYREGYERGGYEHLGRGDLYVPDEDDGEYVNLRRHDLASLTKKGA